MSLILFVENCSAENNVFLYNKCLFFTRCVAFSVTVRPKIYAVSKKWMPVSIVVHYIGLRPFFAENENDI